VHIRIWTEREIIRHAAFLLGMGYCVQTDKQRLNQVGSRHSILLDRCSILRSYFIMRPKHKHLRSLVRSAYDRPTFFCIREVEGSAINGMVVALALEDCEKHGS